MLYRIVVFASFFFCTFAKLNIEGYPSGRKDDTHMHQHIRYEDGRYIPYNKQEETEKFWSESARVTVEDQVRRKPNTNKAKNVILFIGDGMSIPTLAAARVYLGRKNNKTGEETRLSFEKFPYVGLAKTYCVDKQVADSACTATAYLCGVKSNYATIGVTAAVNTKNCEAMQNTSNHVYSIAKQFQKDGRRVGVVTTSRITHASPAGVFAQTAFRNWESDGDVVKDKADPTVCRDIAHQLIHGKIGKKINVILGGGRREFYPNTKKDHEGKYGKRTDGRNLVKEWKKLKEGKSYAYVSDRRDLLKVSNRTKYVLGLFDTTHIPYNLERNVTTKPSLKEMTEKAIKLLSRSKKGYFLFVEGARIDMGHHSAYARKALDETVEFHKAIEAAVGMTDLEDTLIVVSSDHSHTFTMSGYPDRGSDILGIGGISDIDHLPYTTAGYANGPGYRPELNGIRYDVSKDDFEYKKYTYSGMVPRGVESHAGDDVGIFSQGPWAHLLNSVLEQHIIPHVITFAACLSDFSACDL